ncbi:MAG: DNA/RNA non-specific endonuclease [Fusobacteriaceae bacterium]|nr:DNA/RNA non-specific endonuclease [Fusobacteriaceae bacterium]
MYQINIKQDTKEENKKLLDYSEKLDANSFDEDVEGHGGYDLYVQGAQLGYTGEKLESWVNSKRLEQAQEAIKNGATKQQTIALLKTLWDFGPGGNITGLVEAVYGKDLATGEELDLLTRLLSVVGATEFAKGGKLTKEIVQKAIKNDKELQVLVKTTGIDVEYILFTKADDIKDTGKAVVKKADNVVLKDGEQFTKVNGKKVLKPNIEYEANGYKYKTDGQGRISGAEGELRLEEGKRNGYAQKTTDGKTPNDDAGHLIANMFGGSGNKDNLVAMDKALNRKEYRALEEEWKKLLSDTTKKNTVEVKITPKYKSGDVRPSEIIVEYKVNGIKKTPKTFDN